MLAAQVHLALMPDQHGPLCGIAVCSYNFNFKGIAVPVQLVLH